MDITQYVLLAAVIAGATEFLNRLRAKDYWVAATVATAAGIGFLFGVLGVEGLSPIGGLAAGLGASGGLTALGMVGKKSTPTESSVLAK